MNILYYIPAIGQEMGGLRQYAVALLKILAKDTDNKYFVLHDRDDPEVIEVIKHHPEITLLTSAKKNRIKKATDRITGFYIRGRGKSLRDDALDKICQNNKIGVIHCPYQFLPRSRHARSICTMHDVQELHFPEFFSAEARAERAVGYLQYTKNADRIIVSYGHIREDIVKYFNIELNRITVCLLDMGNLWIDQFGPQNIVSIENLHLPEKFLLYPANTWAHKNHLKLLEALELLKTEGRDDIKVVCTGNKTAYYENYLRPYIEKQRLSKQVIFAGVVNENELYGAYKTCVGVVVPTLYEAGSFPLMESILLGVPVICSNVTSLPETICDENFLFDPVDAKQLSKLLIRLWDDEAFRQAGIENCKKQAPRLRNTGALQIVKDLYKEFEVHS